MSRPKGSKNKIQSTFGKNYTNVIQPSNEIVDPAEKQSIEEYNAILNQQDDTLDTFLTETIDKTIAGIECEYMPIKSKSIQKQLLTLMSQIHGEIAPAINNMRKGLTTAFCREEDKYIPEITNADYVKLIGIV